MVSTADNLELITPALTREWFYGRQIVVFTLKEFDLVTIKAWQHAVLDTAGKWHYGNPWSSLHDFGRGGVEFAFREIALDLFQHIPHQLTGFSAFVTVNPLFIQLMRSAGLATPHYNIARDVFANRNTALNWLQMKIERPA